MLLLTFAGPSPPPLTSSKNASLRESFGSKNHGHFCPFRMKGLDSKPACCVCMCVLKWKDLSKLNEQTRAYRAADIVLQVWSVPVGQNGVQSWEVPSVDEQPRLQFWDQKRAAKDSVDPDASLEMLLIHSHFILVSPLSSLPSCCSCWAQMSTVNVGTWCDAKMKWTGK